MSLNSTGQAVMTVLRQTVDNLDAQRDQLHAAIVRDYPAPNSPDNPEPDTHRELRHRIQRDLEPIFADIAAARGALVDAHNALRDVVAPIDLARPR
jgi:hypothetical protein